MRTNRRAGLALAVPLAVAFATGCATETGVPEPPVASVPEPIGPPPVEPRTMSRPDSQPRPSALRLLDETHYSLRVQDAELKTLLLGIGRDSAFNAVIDPGVRGRVSADFNDLPLREILEELLHPLGYEYSVRANVLRVFPAARVTRTYRMDYPNYDRSGSSDVTISGAIAAMPELGDAGGTSAATDSSTSSVQTTQIVDFWTELEAGLRGVLSGGRAEDAGDEESELRGASVVVARQSGLVTVTGSLDEVRRAEAYIRDVTAASQRQVLIDVKILEVDIGDDIDIGVDWEVAADLGSAVGTIPRADPGNPAAFLAQSLAPLLPTGGLMFGVASEHISASLSALALQRDVRVVSTPRIATLNNHKALIKVVRNEVFFIAEADVQVTEAVGTSVVTEFTPQLVPVGVVLDITPQISEDNHITMHIHPSISEVVDVVVQPSTIVDGETIEGGSLPVIDLRETDTVMRVEDQQTLLIGGLIQSRELERQRKIPWLGDIPWLGALFRQTTIEESRTELIILVTPQLLDAPMVTRVRDEALRSIDAISDLRRSRLMPGPWWRRPYGQYYEAEVDDGAL